MKLNSIILADDSKDCDIRDLCVSLREKALNTIQQYEELHTDVECQCIAPYSNMVNKHTLSEMLSLINSNSFISFWYGHGKSAKFTLANEDIITQTENYYIFSNALVYTFSCSNGKDLADTLIANGVKAFVGYTEEIQCPLGMDDVTSRIANIFVVAFIQDGKKVKDAMLDLKDAYNKAVYDESLDVFTRGYYQTNRDALVLKGDGELTLKELLIKYNE